MAMRRYLISLILAAGAACINDPSESSIPGVYQQEFLLLWNLFDESYVGFQEKDVDWELCYSMYLEDAGSIASREEMTALELQLLSHLEDRSIRLISPGGSSYYPYEPDHFVNCDSAVLMEYLEPSGFQWTQEGLWGFCLAGPDSIPYFVIRAWDSSFNMSLFDNILHPLAQEPAVIIDIRLASGSHDGTAANCARRFVDAQVIGHYTQERLGPENHDLAPPVPVTLIPRGWHFEGEVLLLTGEGDSGTSEMFACDMSQLPSVTIMGDTTRGKGNWISEYRELPDGWHVTCPGTTLLTADSLYIEGAGLLPDMLISSSSEDFQNGVDPVLEAAFAFLGAEVP